MTLINDIPDGPHLERLRNEILELIESRRQEAGTAFGQLVTYCGVIYSGGTVAILGYLASQKAPSALAVASLCSFIAALMSFAYFLHSHSQLHAARWSHYSGVAESFFFNRANLEEVIEAGSALQTTWLYRLLFWIPFLFATGGFALGIAAAISLHPV